MLKKFYVWMGISVAALIVGLVLLFGWSRSNFKVRITFKL